MIRDLALRVTLKQLPKAEGRVMAWCPARTHRTWLQAARLPTFRFRQRFDLTVQSVLSVLSLESSLCSLCSLNVICQYMSYVCFKYLHQAFYCRLSLALWIFVDLCHVVGPRLTNVKQRWIGEVCTLAVGTVAL